MYTECPDCHTVFKITPDQLKLAEGKVRCGNCNHVFNALSSLAEQPPIASPSVTNRPKPIKTENSLKTNIESNNAEHEGDVKHSGHTENAVTEERPEPLNGEESSESIAAFHVEDPASEAALSEFSLPANRDMEVSASQNNDVKSENFVSDQGISGLSELVSEANAIASQKSVGLSPDLSDSLFEMPQAEIPELPDQLDELAALDSLNLSEVDEPTADPLHGMSTVEDLPTENPFSEIPEQKKQLEENEVDKDPASMVNQSNDATESTMPLKEDSQIDSKFRNQADIELEDINKDIDAALDDLFDENGDESEAQPESTGISLENDLSISGPNQISGLDELELSSPLPPHDEPSISGPESSMLDLSANLSDELLEIEEPKKQKKPEQPEKPKKLTLSTDSFQLGDEDSFFSNNPLSSETDDWEPLNSSQPKKEQFTNNHFNLDEIEQQTSSAKGNLSRYIWIVIILLLLVVLIGQFFYLKRDELAKNSSLRPIVEQACAMLNVIIPCEVPAPREISAITIMKRNVVSHPNAENALLITSTIKNGADFVQQFPKLVLTFSDINESVLARRVFEPHEYLAKEVNITTGMAPQLPLKIMLEIVDPGEAAVNFEFEFR